ncbi:MAG: Gfo/Idh/MocA family oxidoreductase, partial [Candidatus Dojkabacteria bacterium]
MSKKRVGIIGCGHILVRHLEAIKLNDNDFELVALCDSDKDVLDKALEENNVKGFLDYKEMLKEMKGKM